MMEEHLTESKTMMNGELTIDNLNGTAEFKDGWGQTILRVTHLPAPIPPHTMIDLVAISNVTSYTTITGQEEAPTLGIKPDADGNIPIDKPPGWRPPDYERTCDTCHKVHSKIDEIVMIGKRGLYPEHEYIIETKTKQQKYVRRWRMGYVGKGLDRFHLVFSARGPDRTHSAQYAGDVKLDIREILGIRQVPKDVALRHTGQEVRAGGKAT